MGKSKNTGCTRSLIEAAFSHDFELVKSLVENASTFQPTQIHIDDYEIYNFYEYNDYDYEDIDNNNLNEIDSLAQYYIPRFDVEKFLSNDEINKEIREYIKGKIESNELFIINPVYVGHEGGYEEYNIYRLSTSEVNEKLSDGDYLDVDDFDLDDADSVDEGNFSGGDYYLKYDDYNKSIKNLKQIDDRNKEEASKKIKEWKEIHDFRTFESGYYVLRLATILNYREGYFIPDDLMPFDETQFSCKEYAFITDSKSEYNDADYRYKNKSIYSNYIAQGYWYRDTGMGYGADFELYQVRNGEVFSGDDAVVNYNEISEAADELIEDPSSINEHLSYASFVLIEAIFYGMDDKIKQLIDAGADVNLKDKFGNFPLMEAVYQRNFKLIKMLVEKGANVNQVNNDGKTALMIAEKKRYSEIIKYLKTLTKGEDSMSATNLEGKTFVFTGELSNYTRAEAVAKITEFGGKESKTVNKSTSYVVVGDKPGSKLEKAKSLGVTVLTEEDFTKLLS